jgi:hypothetical protein
MSELCRDLENAMRDLMVQEELWICEIEIAFDSRARKWEVGAL